MPRASKRQSEVARLKELLASAHEIGEQRRKEIDELRKAASQLMVGLTEYAKEENWADDVDGSVWVGGGVGPQVARKYLGLDQEERN